MRERERGRVCMREREGEREIGSDRANTCKRRGRENGRERRRGRKRASEEERSERVETRSKKAKERGRREWQVGQWVRGRGREAVL